MISKFNSKLEYQIKIGKLSITRFAGFFYSRFFTLTWRRGKITLIVICTLMIIFVSFYWIQLVLICPHVSVCRNHLYQTSFNCPETFCHFQAKGQMPNLAWRALLSVSAAAGPRSYLNSGLSSLTRGFQVRPGASKPDMDGHFGQFQISDFGCQILDFRFQ